MPNLLIVKGAFVHRKEKQRGRLATDGSPEKCVNRHFAARLPDFWLLKRAESHKYPGMPESESQTILILLYSALGLLLVLLLLAFGILRRLSRLRKSFVEFQGRHAAGTDSAPSPAETSPGGAFEIFLSEDPSRGSLPKGEQFAEYRKWRQEKGLNWSNSQE